MREDMRIKTVLAAGFGLMMTGVVPAMAGNTYYVPVAAGGNGAKIYPYHGENFCPAGLQPITISGVICCGQPNQSMSYQHMKMTPAAPRKKAKRYVRRYTPQAHCPVGSKGCD
jgi:hypothetical protein